MVMSASVILMSFLSLCLYIAIIVLIAFVILWVVTSPTLMNVALDANILRWGRIVVILLCLIAVVAWLLSILGGSHFPRLL